MAASIVPLLLIAGGVALVLGGGKKAKKLTPEQLLQKQAQEAYAQAMKPATQDLRYLMQVRDWLRRNGREDLAGNVASKIASIQAAIAAREAAESRQKAQKAEERRQWEVEQKQEPLSKAKADELFRVLMTQDFKGDTAQMRVGLHMLRLYGTPEQVAQVTARIAELEAAAAPITTPTEPEAPVVRIPPGEVPPEPEGHEPLEQPPAPPAPPPPTARFPDLPEEQPRYVPPPELAPSPPLAKEIPTEERPPEVPPPLADEEIKAPADPIGTIALARTMITREATTGWKSALQPEIKAWQTRAGLVADGKFGPKSALKMADEVGTLPRIRYWPKGSPSKDIAVKRYRRDVFTKAENLDEMGKREHAAALRVSAETETGQGWPRTPAAEPVSVRDEAADLLAHVIETFTPDGSMSA